MPTVVKHSYVKGRDRNKKMAAHLNYIQYRDDEKQDKRADEKSAIQELNDEAVQDEAHRTTSTERLAEDEPEEHQDNSVPARDFEDDEFFNGVEGQSRRDPNTGQTVKGKARPMFNQDGKRVFGSEVKAEINKLGRNDVVHKLILSPGHNTVDMHKYTHEVMQKLGQQKGQDLRYNFVIHENTDHVHSHVVLLGRDQENHMVRLDRDDHVRIRAFGDRYMEREHGIELRADHDLERFARERGLNLHFDQDKDRLYELLEKPSAAEKQREVDDFLRQDEDIKKMLEEPQWEGQARLGRGTYHLIGEQADLKQIFDNSQQREMWADIHENQPDKRELAEQMMSDLANQRREIFDEINGRTQSRDIWQGLENVSRDLDQESRELQAVLRGHEPRDWDQSDIDASKVKEQDKLTLEDGQVVTKWHDSDFLRSIEQGVRDHAFDKLPFEDYRKLSWWISEKERRGEDCYGTPPLVEKELLPERDEEPEPALDLDALSEDAIADSASLEELIGGKRQAEDDKAFLPIISAGAELDLEDFESAVTRFDERVESGLDEPSRTEGGERDPIDDSQMQMEHESAGQEVFTQEPVSEPEPERDRGDDDFAKGRE